MRGPRLSLSEEFRDTWDKENKDPVTHEFSPRTRRTRIEVALQDLPLLPSSGKGTRVNSNWLDDLLNV
ncbi:hypothetical protein NEHOM01_0182 [Nematocida homosporus]|uniref:uncharacterized protein n=1 Tax=Nematocida homosporus TaxID=1912981 RepID=UPI00222078B9|nr:uncharacterized protein NEHOM01_0182 [Nematocida homosporus]KAI5184507.1 hypothetical protein NEHOM01_0182 [Nematocida homosporus]